MNRIEDFLWRVQEMTTYKPHSMVMVGLAKVDPAMVEVYVSIPSRNAWDHESPYRVGTTHRFPSYMIREMLLNNCEEEAFAFVSGEIRRACHHLELHEADEFLEFDGIKRFDPHRGQKIAPS